MDLPGLLPAALVLLALPALVFVMEILLGSLLPRTQTNRRKSVWFPVLLKVEDQKRQYAGVDPPSTFFAFHGVFRVILNEAAWRWFAWTFGHPDTILPVMVPKLIHLACRISGELNAEEKKHDDENSRCTHFSGWFSRSRGCACGRRRRHQVDRTHDRKEPKVCNEEKQEACAQGGQKEPIIDRPFIGKIMGLRANAAGADIQFGARGSDFPRRDVFTQCRL
jgi:hypothetical protein